MIIWAALDSPKLPAAARRRIANEVQTWPAP
jgi:hypothetical protein